MFRLEVFYFREVGSALKGCNLPHPLPDRKPLQGQVLRKLEDEIAEIEDRSQPEWW
jgi:hypothetical protein